MDKVRDGRGVERRLFNIDGWARSARLREDLPPEAHGAILTELARCRAERQGELACGVPHLGMVHWVGLVVFTGVAAWRVVGDLGPGGFRIVTVLMLIVLPVLWVVALTPRKRKVEWVRRTAASPLGPTAGELMEAMIACGRCPRCAGDLAGRAAEADGCVVCQGCGAAWRASAVPAAGV